MGVAAVCPRCTASLGQTPLNGSQSFWCVAGQEDQFDQFYPTRSLSGSREPCVRALLPTEISEEKTLSSFVSLQIAAAYLLSVAYYFISTPHIYHVINSPS